MARLDVVFDRLMRTSCAALALTLMCGVAPSKGLEQYKIFRGTLVLEGKFVAGDFNRLRDFIGDKANFDKIGGGIFLASPGGSLFEALKIGRLIRALKLNTDAPSGPPTGAQRFGESVIRPQHLVDPRHNYVCASACFFVYVAGIYRNLNWTGRLGIHRPSLAAAAEKRLSAEGAFNLTWQIRELLTIYLKEMDVPETFVDLMYSVPPAKVRWITQREYDADLRGYIPEMKHWAEKNCNLDSGDHKLTPASDTTKRSPTIASKPPMNAGPSPESNDCWLRERETQSKKAWEMLFRSK